MKEILQEIKKKFYQETVFIVAGGPTVNNINITDLNNQKVLAINNSYNLLPHATALYWCDQSWAKYHKSGLKTHNSHLKFTSRDINTISKTFKLENEYNAYTLRRDISSSFSGNNLDTVSGNNSGSQALNFVLNTKPKKVVLIGYDMQVQDGNTHWHNQHLHKNKSTIYSESFIPNINKMVAKFQETGQNTEIINASHASALTCLPIDDYRNHLV